MDTYEAGKRRLWLSFEVNKRAFATKASIYKKFYTVVDGASKVSEVLAFVVIGTEVVKRRFHVSSLLSHRLMPWVVGIGSFLLAVRINGDYGFGRKYEIASQASKDYESLQKQLCLLDKETGLCEIYDTIGSQRDELERKYLYPPGLLATVALNQIASERVFYEFPTSPLYEALFCDDYDSLRIKKERLLKLDLCKA